MGFSLLIGCFGIQISFGDPPPLFIPNIEFELNFPVDCQETTPGAAPAAPQLDCPDGCEAKYGGPIKAIIWDGPEEEPVFISHEIVAEGAWNPLLGDFDPLINIACLDHQRVVVKTTFLRQREATKVTHTYTFECKPVVDLDDLLAPIICPDPPQAPLPAPACGANAENVVVEIGPVVCQTTDYDFWCLHDHNMRPVEYAMDVLAREVIEAPLPMDAELIDILIVMLNHNDFGLREFAHGYLFQLG